MAEPGCVQPLADPVDVDRVGELRSYLRREWLAGATHVEVADVVAVLDGRPPRRQSNLVAKRQASG